MCFSAQASFAVAGVLAPAGAYCIYAAARKNRAFLPIALIPIFFGVQQLCEGFVWTEITASEGDYVRLWSLGFLFFGLMFWLCWIPFSVMIFEPRWRKKVILGMVALLGLAGGLALFLPLALDPELLTTVVVHHSIYYRFPDSPTFATFSREAWQVFYFVVVATPFVVSRTQGFAGFGILLLLSVVVSEVFFAHAFVSVWCFFAALLSLVLCRFFYHLPAKAAPALTAAHAPPL